MNKLITKTIIIAVCMANAVSVLAHSHKQDSSNNNIVEVAAQAGNFDTLIAAAKAAGLVPALTGDGPLTVFAPTDDAFNALPAGTLDFLLKKENQDQLARILTYHVVSGQIGSDALADRVSLKTLAGPQVEFTASESGFTIEGARIVATDIEATNGIVHVIDRVIMPPKQMSRRAAEDMIVSAINQGAPMFNHGQHEKTAKLYAMTMQTLLDNAELNAQERQMLETTLEESESIHASKDRAWQLRHALDDMMASIRNNHDHTTFVH